MLPLSSATFTRRELANRRLAPLGFSVRAFGVLTLLADAARSLSNRSASTSRSTARQWWR